MRKSVPASSTQAELEALPGIGPSKALAIIEYREKEGPFQKPADVQKVPGIGPGIWAQIKDRVTE